MRVRYWTQEDLPVTTTIICDAGITDSLVRYWAKDIDSNYPAYRRAELNYTRHHWRQPGRQALLLVADATEKEVIKPIPASQHKNPKSYRDPSELTLHNELIVGLALFDRLGKSEQALKWRKSRSSGPIEDIVERSLLAAEHFFTERIPNYEPIVDYKRLKQFETISPNWDKEIFAEAWEIGAMYIHPNYHRRGYASTLLDWVLDKAREEDVPVICRGSPIGGLFYQKNGFRSIGDEGFSVLFDETEFGGVNHQMWVWQPENSTGNWYERAKKKRNESDAKKQQSDNEIRGITDTSE